MEDDRAIVYVTVSYCLLGILAYLRARTVHLCSFIEVSFMSSAKKGAPCVFQESFTMINLLYPHGNSVVSQD